MIEKHGKKARSRFENDLLSSGERVLKLNLSWHENRWTSQVLLWTWPLRGRLDRSSEEGETSSFRGWCWGRPCLDVPVFNYIICSLWPGDMHASTKANAFISCTLTACHFSSCALLSGQRSNPSFPRKSFRKGWKKTFWLTDCLWNLSRKRDLLFPFPLGSVEQKTGVRRYLNIQRLVCLSSS